LDERHRKSVNFGGAEVGRVTIGRTHPNLARSIDVEKVTSSCDCCKKGVAVRAVAQHVRAVVSGNFCGFDCQVRPTIVIGVTEINVTQ